MNVIKVADIARQLDLNERSVHKHIRTGDLGAEQHGREWVIGKAEFDRWVTACRIQPGDLRGEWKA